MLFLRNEISPQERFDKALERTLSHISRPSLCKEQTKHLLGWATTLAHAAFHMHPELREDGSFMRYFVVRQARRQGLRGVAVTEFVEQKFRDGIPADYFPDWFVRGEIHDWTKGPLPTRPSGPA